jgi:hypothetical protein
MSGQFPRSSFLVVAMLVTTSSSIRPLGGGGDDSEHGCKDAPWAEWWARAVEERKELPAARRLGRLLKPFGAEPKSLRLTGGSVRRGYDREDLEDAWARYVPVGTATPETTATPLARHVAEVAGVAVLPEVQHS